MAAAAAPPAHESAGSRSLCAGAATFSADRHLTHRNAEPGGVTTHWNKGRFEKLRTSAATVHSPPPPSDTPARHPRKPPCALSAAACATFPVGQTGQTQQNRHNVSCRARKQTLSLSLSVSPVADVRSSRSSLTELRELWATGTGKDLICKSGHLRFVAQSVGKFFLETFTEKDEELKACESCPPPSFFF